MTESRSERRRRAERRLQGSELTQELISDSYKAGTSDGIVRLADGETMQIENERHEQAEREAPKY